MKQNSSSNIIPLQIRQQGTYYLDNIKIYTVANDTIVNRQEIAGGYRYGFNGMERDDAVKGRGNSYTTQFRQYDPRVGRWLTIDPKMKAWESPYVGYSDNPIWFTDPSGADTSGYAGAVKNSHSSRASKGLLNGSKTYKSFLNEFINGKYKQILLKFNAKDLISTEGALGETTLLYKGKNILKMDKDDLPKTLSLKDLTILVTLNSNYKDPNGKTFWSDLEANKTVTLVHEILLHTNSLVKQIFSNLSSNGEVNTSVFLKAYRNNVTKGLDHNRLKEGEAKLPNQSANEIINYFREQGTMAPQSSMSHDNSILYDPTREANGSLKFFELLKLFFKSSKNSYRLHKIYG